MKKISSLLLLMLAVSVSMFAQSTLPKPLNPEVQDWIDSQPIIFNDTITGEPVEYVTNCQMMFQIGMDLMQHPVADDYPGWEGDEALTGELTYTLLDEQYVSYTIFTDLNEIFTFTPEYYSEFTEPTTMIPFGHESMNIEYWFVHFPGRTNNVQPVLDAGFEIEPFFQWRIGIRTNYIVGDQATYSDIVYWEICDKPVTKLGDVNCDGIVNISDITALINYLSNGTKSAPFNKFNADANEDNTLNVTDATTLINMVLNAAG